MVRWTVAVVLFASGAFVAISPAWVRGDDNAIRFGDEHVTRWRVGVEIQATGNVTGIQATTPVFTDWPEQVVKVIDEDISPQVRKPTFRNLDGVKQMVVQIPRMQKGDDFHAILTYEIARKEIDSPVSHEGLILPAKPALFLKYLGASPYIEVADPVLKEAGTQFKSDDEPWKIAEKIYDQVREKVQYKFDPKIKSAVLAWKDGFGDCEELTSLFIAFCRQQGIPARAVWVPGHCYPEFYLVDSQGTGHWYPCQAAGTRDFGRMHEKRPVLQKGDNFKVPEEKAPQRYVQCHMKAVNAASDPVVKFILERAK